MDQSTPASPDELLPAALVGHTIESLHALHGPERGWTGWVILAGLIGALASLPLVRVDVAVRAPGIVRAVGDRVELKTTVSGRIRRVLAADNAWVDRGGPVLEIESGEIDEQLRRQRELQAEQAAIVADLRVLLGPEATPGGLQTAALLQERRQHQAQLDTYRLAEAKARSELARFTTLAAKGIATRQELDNARYEVERLEAESRLLREQAASRWATRLREEEARSADLMSAIRRLEEERSHYLVRAPVAGALVGFSGWAEGGRLLAGQVLGAVSPGGALRVDTQVSTRDIGRLRLGQAVRMQVDAFPYTQWGLLDGEVEAIGADLIGDANGAAYFKVTIRPHATHLTLPNGVRGELRKGLTLTARYVVGRRSLLQILYDDASAWLNPQGALEQPLPGHH